MTVPASPSSRDGTSLPLGIFCIAIGLIALWVARDYDTGTVIAMGPGFFPKAVSIALVLLGGLVLLFRGRDLPQQDKETEPPIALPARLRILACITVSIIVFAAALTPLGLPIATFLMVCIAGAAQHGTRAMTIAVTAACLAVFATLLFAWLLGLQIPVLPQVFQ
jgi:hypothetical protein